MESDVHESKPECYIIDRMENIGNSDEMAMTTCSEFPNSPNSSLVYSSGSNNNNSNNQDKKCGYCSATFTQQQELISHLKTHTFICIECDQTFFDDKALASHMTKHMCKKKWVCKFCNKVFSFRSLLEQHSRSHLGLKPFKCNVCGKHFSRLFNLKVHERQHGTNSSFDCSHCSRKFTHSSNLSKHLRHAHTNQMTHKCMHCPKEFSDLWSLNQHLNSHKAPEVAHTESSFSCKFCPLTFSTADDLNHHLQTHSDKVDLPPKTYTNFNSQNIHIQPHDKEKQFFCEICSKPFSNLANLSRHLRYHSETDNGEYFCRRCPNQKFTSAKLLLEHQKSRHYGKLPFVCDYCHKEFMFRSLLMQHLRKHTGEKPFCCPHCQKSFVRLSNMKTHLKKHENGNMVSEKETDELVPVANFEQQNEMESNNLGWDGSVNLENNSNFRENGQESDSLCSISSTLAFCQNANNEISGKIQGVTFENLSIDQQSVPHDIYFLEAVNQPTSQYLEEIPPVSPLTSSKGIYANETTDENQNENQITFQNLPLQSDNIFFSSIENQVVSNSQHSISPILVKEPAVISVIVTDEEDEKNKDLNITYENLPSVNNVDGDNLLDNQPVYDNQHKRLPTPLKEFPVLPITSTNNDAYADKSTKDSYVINLETDLSSQIDTREDLSTCHPFDNENYMMVEQISTDAVAANNSRILQYLNSQTQELNLIKEVDKRNCLLEETTAVNTEISEFSGSELIDLTEEINDTKTNLNFRCSYCGTAFLSTELLNNHLKLHTVTKPFVCGYCQKSFRYSSLLTQHIKVHRQQISSFRCSHCLKTFSSRNSLILHQQTHKKAHEKPKKALLNCKDCGQQFHSLQDLCHHKCASTVNVFTNNLDKSDNVRDDKLGTHSEHLRYKTRKKINQLHTCKYCGKIFRYLSLLTQHLRRHTGEKPFTCPTCKKSFARLFNLEVHQKQHMKKAQHSFSPSTVHPLHPIKNVATNPVSEMIQPLDTAVPAEELLPTIKEKMIKLSYSCNFCDQSFVTLNDLEKHQQQHQPSTAHPLHPIKNIVTNPVSEMIQPLDTAVPSKELLPTIKEKMIKLSYSCNFCDQSFVTLNDLEKHQQQHQPSTAHSLHPIKNIVTNPISEMIQPLDTAVPSKELLPTIKEKMIKLSYSCNFCDQSFVTLNDLEKHQQQHQPSTDTTIGYCCSL